MTITLANVARALDMNPKNARAKFRHMRAQRPFDHTKIASLTRPQALAAARFLRTDFRAAQ